MNSLRSSLFKFSTHKTISNAAKKSQVFGSSNMTNFAGTCIASEQKLQERERKLAQDLKTLWKRFENRENFRTKSGEILHKLGLIYERKRNRDKLCLVQRATLLFAALLRNPEKKSEFKKI